jgi:2-oxoglutarate ferredoxin oxidoreductase subunit gamma
MHKETIIAGSGGQGIMLIGRLLAQAAVNEGKNTVWLPSYGPEARGGTADCTVIVSTDEIGSPLTTTPDTIIVLNQSSMDKFSSWVKPNGTIVYNSSLAQPPAERSDCRVIGVPASEIADEIGNLRTINMVMLGAYVQAAASVSLGSVKEALADVFPSHRRNLLPINEKAIDRGAELVK